MKSPFSYTPSASCMNLFPCQNSPSVAFTYNAKITVPSYSMAIMNASRDSMEWGNVFVFNQDKPVNGMVLAVGAMKKRQMGKIGIFGEQSIMDQAEEHFKRLRPYMTYLQNFTGPEELPKILLMPPAYPHLYTVHSDLIFFNSDLITADGSHLPTVIKAITESRILCKKTGDGWFLGGLALYVESKVHSKVFGTQSEQFHSHSVWRNLDVMEHYKLTPWRAFVMLNELEKSFEQHAFEALVHSFLHQNGCITFLKFKDMVFSRLPRQESLVDFLLDEFAWNSWERSGRLIPIAPKYDGSFEKKPLELANAWLEKHVPILGIYEELTPAQKRHFFHLLSSLSTNSPLDPMTIDGLATLYKPQYSQDPEIQFRWMLLITKNRDYLHYSDVAELLKKTCITEYCLPVYTELLKDPKGKILARDIFKHHKGYLHFTLATQIDEMISIARLAAL